MAKYLGYLIIGILAISSLFIFSSKTNAAELSQALLRLDNMGANTATGGMVCAQAATPATEGRITITFPSDFTLNTTTSNWDTNTSNLRMNATPWPGIGNPISISGQTVTFPSGDLAPGTLYCFNFAGTNTLTTGATGDKEGTITTRTGANTIIDTTTYGVTIKNSSNVTVSATVAGFPDDFDAELSVVSPSHHTVNENTIIVYKFVYGSNIDQDVSATLEVDWTLGSIGNSGVPSVDVLDYVIGSASDAIGNAPPVIDTVNRRISWNITLPGNAEGEEVTFSLQTNDNYRGNNTVSFSTSARVIAIDTQTPDSTVTRGYLYSSFDAGPPHNPTPTPTPPGTNITPTPVASSLRFEDIDIEAISATQAKIGVRTTIPASLRIDYGESLANFSDSITLLDRVTNQSVQLSRLVSATRYYFTVTATDSSGNSVKSDIFSFRTAGAGDKIPNVNLQSLIMIANNKVLFSPSTDIEILELEDINSISNEIFVVLSTEFPFEFRIAIPDSSNVKGILGFIKDAEVLGINTFAQNLPPETDIALFEITPGVYSGRLLTRQKPGIYDLYVRVDDAFGNITEQKIAKIKVVPPLIVSSGGKPIENAKVSLYAYNPKTQLFSFIPPDNYPIENPAYTEPDGTLRLALPIGKYRAEVKAIGYKEKASEFTIGEFPDEQYPVIVLEPEPFSPLTLVSYYSSTISDLFNAGTVFANNLSESLRFFDLIAIITLIALVATTLFAFSVRTHVPIQHIPLFLIFYARHIIFGHSKQQFIYGEVMDLANGKSLSRAAVEVFDRDTGKLLSKGLTNQAGEFYMRRVPATNYSITIERAGYHSHNIAGYSEHTLVGKLQFFLENKNENYNIAPSRILLGGFENLFGISFETLLLVCLFFELIFISTIGIMQTLPFMVVTILTLLMWVFYASRILRKVISPAY